MINYKKGDKVVYTGSSPFILADGQRVNKEGEVVELLSDMPLQDIFTLAIDMDAIHGEALESNAAFDKAAAEAKAKAAKETEKLKANK